jgi:zinc D-Ala-D-Ala carboxypeptidase
MSQTFSIRELTYSDTAIRLGIDNTPTNEILINLQNVVQFILEPISNNFNSQIVITSGYRSPALCQAIGSSATSTTRIWNGSRF